MRYSIQKSEKVFPINGRYGISRITLERWNRYPRTSINRSRGLGPRDRALQRAQATIAEAAINIRNLDVNRAWSSQPNNIGFNPVLNVSFPVADGSAQLYV